MTFFAVHDGNAYLESYAAKLRREGLAVHVIDNGSRDATPRIHADLLDAGQIVGVDALTLREGFFLLACLEAKERAMRAWSPD